tara:strand:- start:375 stop:1097 length:723 start_codon:yes stop_codon:yes gene_type:complete
MAVSIDTVYQRVLAIANKEQRGYITPQEFNLLANQAQVDIFEQYFYDINQFGRIPGNDTEYSDILDNLNEKISPFKISGGSLTSSATTLPVPANNRTLYRLGTVIYTDTATSEEIEIEEVSKNEILYINSSPLTKPNSTRPVYTRESETTIKVYPTTITSGVTCNYIVKPLKAEWGYTNVNGNPLFNATSDATQNFELHESEEKNLVIKILALAGVILKDPNVYQVAATEESKDVQQEKQ